MYFPAAMWPRRCVTHSYIFHVCLLRAWHNLWREASKHHLHICLCIYGASSQLIQRRALLQCTFSPYQAQPHGWLHAVYGHEGGFTQMHITSAFRNESRHRCNMEALAAAGSHVIFHCITDLVWHNYHVAKIYLQLNAFSSIINWIW